MTELRWLVPDGTYVPVLGQNVRLQYRNLETVALRFHVVPVDVVGEWRDVPMVTESQAEAQP